MATGTLQKLTVIAYTDEKFSSKGKEYTAMLNPESYSHGFNVHYNQEQGQGTPDASLRYEKTLPSVINFDLIFDATGVINNTTTDLSTQIKKFNVLIITIMDF